MRARILVVGASAALAAALCFFLVLDPDGSVNRGGPRTDAAARGGESKTPAASPERRSVLSETESVSGPKEGPARLTVRVQSLDGPISGAQVRVVVGEDEPRQTLTGASGEAQLEDLPPETQARIEVEADGFLARGASVHLPAGAEATVQVFLERAYGLRGFVARFEGGPAAGVLVRLEGGSGPLEARTDPRGRFRFEGARAGERLVVEDAKYGQAARTLDEQALGAGFVVLRLQPIERPEDAAVLAGVVKDTEGAPIAEATVIARRGHRFGWSTTTGDEGRFELFVPAGESYAVIAEAQGARARADAVPAGTLDLELVVVRPGGAIEGRVVRANGDPAPAFTLRWARQGGGRAARRFITDPSGAFLVDGVEAGTWTVEAMGAGGAAGRSRTVDVPEGGRVFVDLRLETPGQMTGQVRDEEGEPVAEAFVQLESRPGLGPVPSTRSGPDGRFELQGIAPGRRSVSAGARGFRRRIVSGLDLQSGQTVGPIEIVLATRGEGGPELDLVGIGAVLAPQAGASGLTLLVREVVAGGGAAEGGLGPGAVILSIDGRSIQELGFDGAIQAIRGREGTTVQLGVSDGAGGTDLVTLLRRRIST